MFNMQRTTPDEVALELFNMGDDLLIPVCLGIAFTPAVQPRIGVDLDKTEVFASAGMGEEGPDIGHFHSVLSSEPGQ